MELGHRRHRRDDRPDLPAATLFVPGHPQLHPPWGNGYATQAAQHVVAFAFTTVSLERLEAMHHPDNPASGRVLAKVGFTRTGTSDRCVEDGPAVPYQVYALPLPRAPLPR
ncbi:GNAT family N-acetyltransferase [Streptomyces glebosus]|uniref:GNAT family N-acetyltransferase n=1 Tax=Streptomyces glebosus TaxID=249580 RepID=UPI0019BCD616|nr:GNAT family N-acetyltransferase [Streptomyces glebosus]GHG91425.1 hypothetical protein GCM10010513_74880 [Streptomyces glebosus]